MTDQIRVLLSTEGTYPFHQGGVSTWCENLINKLDVVDFFIYSIIANPFVTQKFQLPKNASLQTVPLWGMEEPKEHLAVPFSEIYLSKENTTTLTVQEHFIPLFIRLIEEVISEVKKPQQFAHVLLDLYHYFQKFDYQVSFKSELTWNVYKDFILKASSNKTFRLSQPDVYGLIQSLGWLYRFLSIVNAPIPETHVTHSTAAAFCGIPCVLAKLKNNTPFLLTEHGIYLREQYISLSKRGYSSFLTTFLIRFIQSISTLNYTYADQVSPVCQYNTRWETRFGVPIDRIHVIQNGVDQHVFTDTPSSPNVIPTVVMTARIDPVKDILTFLRAAAIVRDRFPNVKFVLYGSVSVSEYFEECKELREKLRLHDSFIFAGHTSNIVAAYQSGDIIALTSISEAFPYSVVEAMMVGKPVVATDVGGVKEALGNTGLLVDPIDPEAFAEAILKLLNNSLLRSELGREARERALNFFTLDKVLDLYLKSYIRLASHAKENVLIFRKDTKLENQKLLLEKGYALMSCGLYQEAISHFRTALKEKVESPYTPVLLTEISEAYNRLGEYDLAFQELEKYSALV
ncbi:glycosyltransferase involved in cell wall biosynthesis [Aneurinibacillus soli]|uniref:D-inositol 3-phosphate glycosyltransferase n=1 Tax=Aneurinibacillus soli TaxID=1500254 RepID=A0A0U5CAE8_9BACL|nr:GT4 family glycosyltransferase PelF [Aneurinibacillus soli]PYE61899.1 glycosyltransferase involved in cell wall biosynthesis [Aneurinibacillus soli]BAU29715.1 D-inositol 3-phosphate glycosyltransferase [Aneurinibacillus soli]